MAVGMVDMQRSCKTRVEATGRRRCRAAAKPKQHKTMKLCGDTSVQCLRSSTINPPFSFLKKMDPLKTSYLRLVIEGKWLISSNYSRIVKVVTEDGSKAASIRQAMADHTGDEVLLWRLQGGQENRPRRGYFQ